MINSTFHFDLFFSTAGILYCRVIFLFHEENRQDETKTQRKEGRKAKIKMVMMTIVSGKEEGLI